MYPFNHRDKVEHRQSGGVLNGPRKGRHVTAFQQKRADTGIVLDQLYG
jgi:hypothetical protein